VNRQWHKSKIDHEQLRLELRTMSEQSKLRKLIQEEVTRMGHWCAKPRGNPKKGYANSHAKNV